MIDVAAVAQRCLDAVIAVHDENQWPLPERRYVAGGNALDLAADDEHLLVALQTLQPGSGQNNSAAVQSKGLAARAMPYGTFIVRLMRCVPGLDDHGPPTAEDLHASGLTLLTDVGRLYTSLVRWRDREKGFTSNALVSVGQIEPIDGGDLAGHLAYLTISPVQ